MSKLLDAALAHLEAGRRVISTYANKRPACGEGWDRWWTEPQTEDDIRRMFRNGAYGIGILMYPASQNIALDFDGPHADEAWRKTGIALADTARSRTPSGGAHSIYRTPIDTSVLDGLKRKVRLIEADCDCTRTDEKGELKPHKCGVDLLVNGYSIEALTPGYVEDPDFPLEDATIIQAEVIELAWAEQRKQKASKSRTSEGDGERIGDGERNARLASLAGSMRNRGMTYDEILAALLVVNSQRCDPPLGEREVEGIAKSYARYEPGIETENLTDLGNSRRFAKIHDGDVKYSPAIGWLIWDGKRYRKDDTQAIVRLAREVVQTIYAEAATCTDNDRREALGAWAIKCESEQRINAMISLAESEASIAVTPDVFDRDPWLFNCRNGTIDLKSGQLREHRRDDLITKISAVDFDFNASCPTWLKFVERIFNNDVSLIPYVQKLFGYGLSGLIREQQFYLLWGSGANGKSTLVKTFISLLGDYATQASIETFLQKQNAGQTNDIARLAGARMVAAMESDANRKLAESLIKQLTGGDRVTARFHYKEFFEYDPTYKIILSTNHRPRISGTDYAIWRRVRLIPFTVTIPEAEQDSNLFETLKTELSGILAWAFIGWQKYRDNGLKPPTAVIEASKQYKDDCDILGDFFNECCEFERSAALTAKELYAAYKTWAERAGERVRSQKALATILVERGLDSLRTRDGVTWVGLRLKA
jgi:P4 family phage/plasmid primase-like protien